MEKKNNKIFESHRFMCVNDFKKLSRMFFFKKTFDIMNSLQTNYSLHISKNVNGIK